MLPGFLRGSYIHSDFVLFHDPHVPFFDAFVLNQVFALPSRFFKGEKPESIGIFGGALKA
jgi:hypothetical protein